MTYNLLTVNQLLPGEIAEALATCFRVPVESVDVADADGDQDARNWDAAVLCDYSQLRGDLALSLDIDIQNWVPERPAEADLALALSIKSGSVVLYPAEEKIPSAYWAVTPEPLVTRARLVQSDEEVVHFRVDAVEEPVAGLPNAQVMQLPEILAAQTIPTPATGQFVAVVEKLRESHDAEASGQLEDKPGTLIYEVRTSLFLWERMVRRMESGWRPGGKYPIDLYRKDLALRDELAQLVKIAPPVTREALADSIQKLDDVLARCTVQDEDGLVIGRPSGAHTEQAERGWWWRRRPDPMPWAAG
ncbi:hypothetical protein [Streptomyces sp. WZ-12]|uniref:hypothetical protein n=1 Tax=Streptomyces sp. WZ-12 TaxID=3030210 RepID=UPI002380DF24|nr:hypothetical protein [Streptomyces sp. WZ-12]